MGVKFDLILVLRSQFFENLRETLHKHLEAPGSGSSRIKREKHLRAPGSGTSKKKRDIIFLPTVNARLSLTSLKACDWSGHIFGASASPRSLTKKKLAMPPHYACRGGQHVWYQVPNMWYSSCYCMRHSFVADEIWDFMLEPARTYVIMQKGGCRNGHKKSAVQQLCGGISSWRACMHACDIFLKEEIQKK